jgi:hypothetical protein
MANIAIGYWAFRHTLGTHYERALRELGHRVTYVGLPTPEHPGYDQRVPLNEILDSIHPSPEFYLWIDPAGPYFPSGIEQLSIPTACYLVDVHLGTWRTQVARFFDAVFIAQKRYLDTYRAIVQHPQLRWLPLAAPSELYTPGLPRIYDVGFVGSMTRAHRNTPRAQRLHMIQQRYRTNDWTHGYSPAEMGDIYSQSRTVVNISINGDVNMRLFEGTMCGALMLTDSTTNGLEELYLPGQELVSYQDDADLTAKLDYFLSHEDERVRIALAGQQRANKDHTYLLRAQTIVNTLNGDGFQTCAPMRQAPDAERWAARREIYTHLHMLDAMLDEARARGESPIQRAYHILPCLARRIMI